jgi:alkylhydroperoxidase family enzyme
MSDVAIARQGGEQGHNTAYKPKLALRLDAREAEAIKVEARQVYGCSMGLFVANLWRNYRLSGKRLEMLPPEWVR